MKKLIASILISFFVLVTPIGSIYYPPKAHALFGAGDVVFDPVAFANLVKQLVELQKLYENATKILDADVRSILGKYGLGALSPVMDKFLGGAGLKDLLVDEIGGAIGAGGFLEGALSGVLNPEDTVSTLLKQFGLKLPSGLYDKLKDIGYLNTEGILGDIVKGGGGACGVRDEVSYQSIRTVLLRQGLDLNIQEIGEHVAACRFDADAILKDFIAKPTPTLYIPPILSSSCSVWRDGVCTTYRTSFGGAGDNAFFSSIPTQPSEIIPRIAQIVLGIAGGIALLILIIAGYKLIISKGKPESVQSAREQVIAAIVGLLFIIMSFVIFQLVAVDLLKVPGICRDAGDPNCARQTFETPQRSVRDVIKNVPPKDRCLEDCVAANESRRISCNNGVDDRCEDLVNSFKPFDSGKCYREGIIACSKITNTAERTACNTNAQNECRKKADADKPPSKTDCIREGVNECMGKVPSCEDQCK